MSRVAPLRHCSAFSGVFHQPTSHRSKSESMQLQNSSCDAPAVSHPILRSTDIFAAYSVAYESGPVYVSDMKGASVWA